jgi:phage shock protein A
VGSIVQRVETRIREMQSRADAIEGLVAEGVLADVLEPDVNDIDRELTRVDRQQAIENELARLKGETS